MRHVFVYESSCHYYIKMYVPSQDSVRVMYMCMRVPATILLRCVCTPPGKYSGHVYVYEGSYHYFNKMYGPSGGQCSGHVYVYEGSCHYSIKMHVPSHHSVRVMYMCMKVPATILLRCMGQAMTMFGPCICV